MAAFRRLVLPLLALALSACVAPIPEETRERLRTIAVVPLLGPQVRHVDREWWNETYFEQVCVTDSYNGRRFRRCWLEPRTRTMSRTLAIHIAPLTAPDVDAGAAALFRARVGQGGGTVRVVEARFGTVAPGALAAPSTEAAALAPAVVERLRAIATQTGADGVVVLQGECSGPGGDCWAASLERSRPAHPHGQFSGWAPTGRFHAWLFDPVKGALVSRWSAPEMKVVRAGWGQQPPPPALDGAAAGALDPAAALVAQQSIRFAVAELADDFLCALQGARACERARAEGGATRP